LQRASGTSGESGYSRGAVSPAEPGYVGTIRTLTVNVKARIVANDQKKSEGAPDFRVYAGRTELGAAWKAKTNGEEPRDNLSLQLDDPSFPEPIRAALFEEDGAAFLVWNRREG
jgi:uncharacterized protein (DUF736 family)